MKKVPMNVGRCWARRDVRIRQLKMSLNTQILLFSLLMP